MLNHSLYENAKSRLPSVFLETTSLYTQLYKDQSTIKVDGNHPQRMEHNRVLDSLKARLDILNFIGKEVLENQGPYDPGTELLVSIENGIRCFSMTSYDDVQPFGIYAGYYGILSTDEIATFKRKVLIEVLQKAGFQPRF